MSICFLGGYAKQTISYQILLFGKMQEMINSQHNGLFNHFENTRMTTSKIICEFHIYDEGSVLTFQIL